MSPSRDLSEAELARAMAALYPFVDEWNLPLNPENIQAMAGAVLLHARPEGRSGSAPTEREYEEIDRAVRELIAEERQKAEGLYRDEPSDKG